MFIYLHETRWPCGPSFTMSSTSLTTLDWSPCNPASQHEMPKNDWQVSGSAHLLLQHELTARSGHVLAFFLPHSAS